MAVSSLSGKKPRRPVGRPRNDGKPHLTKARVFAVSARLIGTHGYAGAGIRMIAEELGAAPASLFHLFGSKEGLLNALIAYAAVPSLAFYKTVQAAELSPDVALYKSIYEEVRLVAGADPHHVALFYLPELRQPGFEAAQKVRADMVAHYDLLITAGCASGQLETPVPGLAAEQAFQLSETSVLATPGRIQASPAQQAAATADLFLKGVLTDPQRLTEVRAAALAVKLEIELSASG